MTRKKPMTKIQEISDYRILGYSDKDKRELADREKALKPIKSHLRLITSEELQARRCKAYKYLLP